MRQRRCLPRRQPRLSISSQLLLLIDLGLFLVKSHSRDFSSIDCDGPLAEIQAHPVLIHEWGPDYAIILINVDEVEIYLVFKLIDIHWNTGAIADL